VVASKNLELRFLGPSWEPTGERSEVGQGAVEIYGLAERHVRIVLAVQDQHRRADLRGVGDRAELVVAVRAGPRPAGTCRTAIESPDP